MIQFYKYEGCGNDFIIVLYEDVKDIDHIQLCKSFCHRHYGVGADGLIIVKLCPIEMKYYNKDGTTASMCGNGIRCLAQFLKDYKYVENNEVDIISDEGIKHIQYNDDKITVAMGTYKDVYDKNNQLLFDYDLYVSNDVYHIYSLYFNVMHTVIVCDHFYNVYSHGKDICYHELFKDGTNVNFAKITNRNHIKVRTYEKGVGVTLACGTGACASVLVLHRLGLCDDEVEVEMLGGCLKVSIKDDEVYMCGDAHFVFEGKYIEKRSIYEKNR